MNASASDKWGEWRDHAVAVSILDVAARLGARLKKTGADHIGPCPLGCAKVDGFVVTPAKSIFFCRPSGATGDVIELVQHVQGCSYAEALEFITGEMRPDRSRGETEDEKRAREARWRDQQAAARKRDEEAARQEAARQRRSKEHIVDVLERAVPIAGTHAEAYLMRGRRLEGVAKRFLSDLRFVPDLTYWGFADERARKPVILADALPTMIIPFRNAAGATVGLHQTFLDPVEPRKWRPLGDERRNEAKKMRGVVGGALLRLGRVSEVLAVAEGIETALSWALVMTRLGRLPEGISLAAAGSIGNLCGKATGTIDHPDRKNDRGQPTRIANGNPDMDDGECMVLPDGVRELILLADSDGDHLAAWAKIGTAVERFAAQGIAVRVHRPPVGMDWANVLETMS